MRTFTGLAVIIGAIALGAPPATHDAGASDQTLGVSIGALAGVAFPSATGASSRLGWGFEGDYSLLPPLSAGIYFLSSSQDTSIPAVGSSPAVSASTRISLYGAQAAYHFAYPGLSGGARLGVAHNSTDIVNGGSTTDNSFSIGPYVAYDFHFAPQFSVGGDASILFVTANQSYNVVNLLASIKVWL